MQHLQQANAAGRTSPINENGRRENTAASGNTNTQQTDSRQTTEVLQPDRAKHLATLTARCALAGVTLIESTDDRGRPAYVVSRWSLTRQLANLSEVVSWLDHVTGAQS